MFGLITIDGDTFIIVKEDVSKNGELPKICPFETYGFLYKQEGHGKIMFSLITKSKEVESEYLSLVEKAMNTEPLFRTKI